MSATSARLASTRTKSKEPRARYVMLELIPSEVSFLSAASVLLARSQQQRVPRSAYSALLVNIMTSPAQPPARTARLETPPLSGIPSVRSARLVSTNLATGRVNATIVLQAKSPTLMAELNVAIANLASTPTTPDSHCAMIVALVSMLPIMLPPGGAKTAPLGPLPRMSALLYAPCVLLAQSSPLSGQSSCVECQPGHFAVSKGHKACEKCHPGTYSVSRGAAVCLNCPPGKSTNTNSGSTSCGDCSKGHYQPEAGQFRCKECPDNTYQDQTGKTFCLDCPAGKRTTDRWPPDQAPDISYCRYPPTGAPSSAPSSQPTTKPTSAALPILLALLLPSLPPYPQRLSLPAVQPLRRRQPKRAEAHYLTLIWRVLLGRTQ